MNAGTAPFPTVLIGFGRIAQGYASDPVMAQQFAYSTHAQVLRDHPRFAWRAVIDPSEAACQSAREDWPVPVAVGAADDLGDAASDIEVAVIATGPEARLDLLSHFPRLKAVIVEKPLGRTHAEAEAFVAQCDSRGVIVTVNLWRRADRLFRALAAGQLRELIGDPQSIAVHYGNGLVNNGTHMVDFVRMLFGEIAGFELLGRSRGYLEGPIPGDTNPLFALELARGQTATFSPLDFRLYRENGLTAWGTTGRLDILAEGLAVAHFPVVSHRAMSGEKELAVDSPRFLEQAAGHAIYDLYDNLAHALDGMEDVCSPASSALETAAWIDRIREADLARSNA